MKAYALILVLGLLSFGCLGYFEVQESEGPVLVGESIPEEIVEEPQAVYEGNADALFAEADALYGKQYFNESYELYAEARGEYLLAGDNENARKVLFRMFSVERILLEFVYTEEGAKASTAEALPDASQIQIGAWFEDEKVSYFMISGKKMYYESIARNIMFLNPELLREGSRVSGKKPFYDELSPLISEVWDESEYPYSRPIKFVGTEIINLPRSELAEEGVLNLWVPVPVETESQRNVEVVSITPEEYVIGWPDTEEDIGIAYLEIPLGELEGDLNITITFTYTSYEKRFKIDPAQVGEYDTKSKLYTEYTRSSENIVVNAEVEELAIEIVGGETNPYLAAEKLYWFVVNGTSYNLMPHATLSELGIPESEYAREHEIGDCGTQSMYFSALCRSIGIPARATGGYQLVPGHEGTHFWAEFYLPEHGWIPVDVTVAEIADWEYNLTGEEEMAYKSYFFGNLDPYRYVMQKDVDQPLVPEPSEPVVLPVVLQFPSVVCETCEKDVGVLLVSGWKVEVAPVE